MYGPDNRNQPNKNIIEYSMENNVEEKLDDESNGHYIITYQQYHQMINLMSYEIISLKQNCKILCNIMDNMRKECENFYQKFKIYQMLFLEEKSNRKRLSKLLTSSQRELEFHKRSCNRKISSRNFYKKKHHHKVDFNDNINKNLNPFRIGKENRYKDFFKGKKSKKRLNNNRKVLKKINKTTYYNYDIINADIKRENRNFWENNENYKNFQQNNRMMKLKSTVNDLKFIDKNHCKVESSLINNEDYFANISQHRSTFDEFIQRKLSKKSNGYLGLYFDLSFSNKVVVNYVTKNSAADKAGIKPGDCILEICGINMRNVNYRMAEKVMENCEEEKIMIKLDSNLNNDGTMMIEMEQPKLFNKKLTIKNIEYVDEDFGTGHQMATNDGNHRKKNTLTRRDAFLSKNKNHIYFHRRSNERLALKQASHFTISLPRRINIKKLENVKLCGGNAVGIFVHSIVDDLASFLNIGDQLLEYNRFDLTKATAEDASIYLAKQFQNSELVAVYNIDAYNQFIKNPIGDSFYIRTEFKRLSTNGSLAFDKGDILYVDNTLYDGKPGKYWRAWKVDQFGKKRECGFIPSKYNADCELFQLKTTEEKRSIFKSARYFFQRLFTRSKYGYINLDEETRVLATFTQTYTNMDDENNDPIDPLPNMISYQMVQMNEYKKPRPVIIFGPYSHIIAEKVVEQFSTIFRLCPKKTQTMMTRSEIRILNSQHKYDLIPCTKREEASEFISMFDLQEIIQNGLHPIISVVGNSLNEFHKKQIYPILFEIKFRSIKHLKDTVNKQWNLKHFRISSNTAKAIYQHQLKVSKEFHPIEHITLSANNMKFICTLIKQHVINEQNKVVWSDV